MTTAPSAVQAAQNVINEAFRDLCTRIKSGRLAATSKNGTLLVDRVKKSLRMTLTTMPTAKQLVDAFYRSISDVEFARQLEWEKLPAALAKRTELAPVAHQDPVHPRNLRGV